MKAFRLLVFLLIAPMILFGQRPTVNAGEDRDVVTGGKTYLSGVIKSSADKITWSKVSGPGAVVFSHADKKDATATFSAPGEYVLQLTATEGAQATSSTLKVSVHEPPPAKRLDVVYTKRYKIDSKLWSDRLKTMIVNWIPWCIDQCERTDLTTGDGGIDNFIEAAKALRGEPHNKHKGYVFSNAWVHQTVESMCEALMVDPQGDAEMIAAQAKMKKTLDKWIPIILSAQEPDGYLQTAFTLRDTSKWHQRWSPERRGNHEGYVAGYFIESAINHYTLTEGKDKRLYNAAKKLADCWVANIGPGKKTWYDGHQEMEQALVRFGRFVNDMEGKKSHGDSYIRLAKFLLDSRNGGSSYDQSHVPVQQQYEAVGHAVRAVYNYSGMADVAAETGDKDYQSAVLSLWDNMVNKKYYLTGGIGSGETSEGFGPNYSLGNNAYCESCSSCGLIFFQYKMNLAYHDAKYADLYEETMYNALLGSLDLNGKNFTYTNPLNTAEGRYQWHVCPCCVGNIPRTLLMIPTWTYVKGTDGLYVNLFIGSTINVEKVAGTDVEMIQKTDYPWSGNMSLVVNPKQTKAFTLYIRVPNRATSKLYTTFPQVSGLESLMVNGQPVPVKIEKGYAVIKRTWKKGDRVTWAIPMQIQKVTADNKIKADQDKVALRYGPLVYNVEQADQPNIDQSLGNAPLSLEWQPNFLHGIMAIKGKWADGTPLLAIPNYARLNRVPTTPHLPPNDDKQAQKPLSVIWMKK
ncbi:glycoside hydrolase family 127 protein [Niabella soli]|nr:beta-L-arabinofuranosidase domain-containing protein [Niabella soli]